MPRKSAAVTNATTELGLAQDWNITQSRGGLVPELSGWQMLRELELMASTDETVGSMLWAIASIMAQVGWKHEPQVDGERNTTDREAVRWAAWADGLLIDMQHSWGDYIDDALNMIWAGFSLSEMTMKQRTNGNSRFDDGLYGFDRLSLRDPMTIWGWLYDPTHRNVIAAQQNTYWGSATIPTWKTLHTRPTMAPERPVGRSLLRAAHRVWRLKMRIQDSEAIGIERELTGLPIARVPNEDLNTAATVDPVTKQPTPEAQVARSRISSMTTAVTKMRFNQSGGIVMPSDTYADETEGKDKTPKYDLSIMTSSGQRAIDARTAARDYDRSIARVVMMQFLHLGDRSTGSFGLSDDQSSMAIRAMMALAIKIGEEWDRKALALTWNLNVLPNKYRPSLKPTGISKDGIAAVGQFIAGLAKAAPLWETDTKARISILAQSGIDYDANAQEQAAGTATTAAETAAIQPKPTSGTPTPPDDPEASLP